MICLATHISQFALESGQNLPELLYSSVMMMMMNWAVIGHLKGGEEEIIAEVSLICMRVEGDNNKLAGDV